VSGQAIGAIIGSLGAFAIAVLVVLIAPDVADTMIRVGHLIIAVGGGIICVGVLTWAWVEAPDWPLRNVLRMVMAVLVLAAIGTAILLAVMARRAAGV